MTKTYFEIFGKIVFYNLTHITLFVMVTDLLRYKSNRLKKRKKKNKIIKLIDNGALQVCWYIKSHLLLLSIFEFLIF